MQRLHYLAHNKHRAKFSEEEQANATEALKPAVPIFHPVASNKSSNRNSKRKKEKEENFDEVSTRTKSNLFIQLYSVQKGSTYQ